MCAAWQAEVVAMAGNKVGEGENECTCILPQALLGCSAHDHGGRICKIEFNLTPKLTN